MITNVIRLIAAATCLIFLATGAFSDQEETRRLIAVLESNAKVEEKADVCRQLGENGTAEAVPALAKLLNHKVLNSYARTGLERISDPGAAAALRMALGTTEGNFLTGVITSLSALRDEKAVPALQKLASGQDTTVSEAAFLALGRIASDESSNFVLKALTSEQEETRKKGAAALLLAAQMRLGDGSDMALKLFETVRSAKLPLSYRIGATRGAIMARKSDEQVSFLLDQLNSSEPAMRNVALLTIREIPSSPLADALHREIPSAAPDVRVQLIIALKDCHNENTFRTVRELLNSDDAPTRMAALQALRSVDGPPSQVASTLLEVLLNRRTVGEAQTAIDTLATFDSGGVDNQIVAALVNASTSGTQIDLIGLLGARNAAVAEGALLKHARAEDGNVRIAALRALKGIVGSGRIPELIALVKGANSSAETAAAVSTTVSACGTGESKELILEELQAATDSEIRSAWIRILTATGYTRALPVISASLNSNDSEAVSATISQLSKWPDPAPVEGLLKFLESASTSEAHRRAALISAIRLVAAAAGRELSSNDVLIGWLQRANNAVASVPEKRQLISALSRVKDVRSLPLLTPYLKGDQVKVETAYAIMSVAESLRKGSDREAAKAAMEEITGIEEPELLKKIEEVRRALD